MNTKVPLLPVGMASALDRGTLRGIRMLSLSLLLACAGCLTGPDYHRPEVDTPQSWRFDASEAEEAREIANAHWWEQFDDPVLNDLVETALQENKDLKMAAARIELYTALYRTTQSGLFPKIGGSASGGRGRGTEKGPQAKVSVNKAQQFLGQAQQAQALVDGLGALANGTGSASTLMGLASQLSPIPTPKIENPVDSFQTGLNASWEIDLWGKLRRANESARADLLSAEAGRHGVLLMLVTAVAENYVNLRNLDRVLDIAQATVKTRKESYRLFKLRFEKGVISQLELSQVQSQYEQARSTLPAIERAVAQQENALSVLLGHNPGPIARGKTLDELVLPSVPADLPSNLLANRPDIRQAEQSLISANARIGVARAQYFPSISLTGMFGRASTDIADLFTGPAKAWSYAAPITVPIFTAGAISGRVKAAKAAQQEALVRYQQTIQNAFREVEDSLIGVRSVREELDAQTRTRDAFRTYARLAGRRYESGYSSYIEVLDAERGLFNAELAVAQTRGNLFQSLVYLYKAMGSGWPSALQDVKACSPPEHSLKTEA
jgi:outer membrane protein, multidrug efflux system